MIIKKYTLFFIFFFSLFFSLLFSFNVSAVSLGGALGESLIFEPGMTLVYDYSVGSDTDKTMDHEITAGGDLGQYVTLDKTVLNLAPGEGGGFRATINLPNELEPGWHIAYICVAETQPRGPVGGSGTAIGAKLTGCAWVKVLSLYPEPLASFEFYTQNVAQGDIAYFTLKVFSMTKRDMTIVGDVDIYPKDSDTKITTLRTDRKILRSGQTDEIRAALDTDGFDVGAYRAVATLYYEGKEDTKEKPFMIGDVIVEIVNFTKAVPQGKINPIDVEMQSKWNSKLDNVYATAEIRTSNDILVTELNSPFESIGAWENKNITLFWDTNVSTGNYNIKITLHYEDRTSTKDGEITVLRGIGMPALTATVILLAVLIILIVILLIIMIRTMEKMKRGHGDFERGVSKKRKKKRKKKKKRGEEEEAGWE